MKIRKLLMSLMIIILLISVPFAMQASGAGSVLYKNDFESGKLDEIFTATEGTAQVIKEKGNSFMRLTKNDDRDGYLYVAFEKEAKDFDYSFKVRITSFNNSPIYHWAGFVFKAPTLPPDNSVCYDLRLYKSSTQLYKNNRFAEEPDPKMITENDKMELREGFWSNVQISTRGERIVVYVNGEMLIDVKDDFLTNRGGFGFYCWGTDYDIDDINISEYSSGSTEEPAANERPDWMGDGEEEDEIIDDGLLGFTIGGTGGNKGIGGGDNPVTQNPGGNTGGNTLQARIIAFSLIGVTALLILVTALFAVLTMRFSKKEKNIQTTT